MKKAPSPATVHFLHAASVSIVSALVEGYPADGEDKDEKHNDSRGNSERNITVLSAAHCRSDLSCATSVGAALLDERVRAHLAYLDLLLSFDDFI